MSGSHFEVSEHCGFAEALISGFHLWQAEELDMAVVGAFVRADRRFLGRLPTGQLVADFHDRIMDLRDQCGYIDDGLDRVLMDQKDQGRREGIRLVARWLRERRFLHSLADQVEKLAEVRMFP